MTARPPILLFALGNPSRGDDALGWHFAERARVVFAADIAAGRLEILTDFQLQVEHALDLAGRTHVIFVDASVSAPAPFSLGPVTVEPATAFSHASSPGHLLGMVAELGLEPPERSEIMAIRGDSFELGEPLGPRAAEHLEQALSALSRHLGRDVPPGLGLTVTGIVQGVGFRPFVARTARALGLGGSVRNGPEGVDIELWGAPEAIATFIATLQDSPPLGAVICAAARRPLFGTPPKGLDIAPSVVGDARISIPPDLAICAECRRDIADPENRRFDHAFTTCTACGPRLSIVTALPYDRGATEMAHFPMCQACATEYANLEDRRFHAQAIACPDCGPRLDLLGPDRQPLAGPGPSALDAAAALLKAGKILAIQGLGGFHLACDATSPAAVARLRERKGREAKPFAVMVADVGAAANLVAPEALTSELSELLDSPVGPIVVTPGHPASPLAPNVCAGFSEVGLFLPTTPLHARLLARLAPTPLVMTSGNVSGAPVVISHAEAFHILAPIADAFLVHDRPITRRVEDAVVVCDPRRPSGTPPSVIRRARGYAPRPIRLPVTPPTPVLAVGGHMKNTAAIVIGDECWLTPHLGDLESHTAEAAWVREVEGFEKLLGVQCNTIVHDAHPDYATTRYAERRGGRNSNGVQRFAVQHHHAHTLAVLAERRYLEPVVAVAFDGTGWGPDGTAWGGEILRIDGLAMTRPSAFRPIPLPGGEHAIRHVWRAAYGALFDAFGPETPAIVARLDGFAGPRGAALGTVHAALEQGVGVVPARGIGRYFDAIGSLVLGRATTSFEGEIPMRFEELADASSLAARPYPFAIPTAIGSATELVSANEIDLRPTIRAIVADVLSHTPAATIAARFHTTLVAATLDTIEHHHLAAGVRKIVLSGGVFQNRRLAAAFRRQLGDVVLDPVEVPVHDGGIALGQALAGALLLANSGPRPQPANPPKA